MGKGVANERLPNFVGMYNGAGSRGNIAKIVESSDLVITIGNVKSDLNTSGFSYHISRLNSVDLHFDNVIMDYAKFGDVYMKWLLQRLNSQIEPSKLRSTATEILPSVGASPAVQSKFPDDVITHSYLWPRISSWLKSGDVVVAETGTSYVGIWETDLPSNVHVISQILWSSIGYGVGACQGAAQALKTQGKDRRTICFEGDGKRSSFRRSRGWRCHSLTCLNS